jgi:hypothetical protein
MNGEVIHGEVSSDDASAGVAFSLYTPDQVARTLASTETLIVTDLIVVSAPGGAIKVVNDADSAGRRILIGTVSASGGIAHSFDTGWQCKKGVVPKLIAPAGQVDAILSGYILRA